MVVSRGNQRKSISEVTTETDKPSSDAEDDHDDYEIISEDEGINIETLDPTVEMMSYPEDDVEYDVANMTDCLEIGLDEGEDQFFRDQFSLAPPIESPHGSSTDSTGLKGVTAAMTLNEIAYQVISAVKTPVEEPEREVDLESIKVIPLNDTSNKDECQGFPRVARKRSNKKKRNS